MARIVYKRLLANHRRDMFDKIETTGRKICTMKKEKVEILLSITLLISMYLTFIFKSFIPKNQEFLALIPPVTLAYLNKKPKVAIIISIIIAEYLIRDLNYSLIITSLFFILLFICFRYYNKTNKKDSFIVNISIILSIKVK